MKAVILAGGLGTRLSEETIMKPKPMVEIGGKPILWHIMKTYSSYGVNDFIICCGYKGYIIKEYFSNYFLHTSDVTFNFRDNSTEIHSERSEPWKVTLVDTGDTSMTGGRLLRIRDYVQDDDCFCFTYGDGLADVNIQSLINFHRSHGKSATMTATEFSGRFGELKVQHDQVTQFSEKPKNDGSLINAGYFVLNSSVFNYLTDDSTVWERFPLESLASNGELMAFHHSGFWKPMDTLRDKMNLEDLWDSGHAPWKVW
jgi:glucose-1-phosphate cytidylyltransferase